MEIDEYKEFIALILKANWINVDEIKHKKVSGIYFIFDTKSNNNLIYIGKSTDVVHRLENHPVYVKKTDNVMVYPVSDKKYLYRLESKFIKLFKPSENINGKGKKHEHI